MVTILFVVGLCLWVFLSEYWTVTLYIQQIRNIQSIKYVLVILIASHCVALRPTGDFGLLFSGRRIPVFFTSVRALQIECVESDEALPSQGIE
jgi:hypothetical protein